MNYYNEIKEILINNEITKKVKDYSKNKSDLESYYNVGKILSEAGKHYGERIIKEYSRKLTNDLGKGYSVKSLFKYRKFYLMFQKFSTVSRILTWSHYSELLVINDINEIYYYIKISEIYSLSVRELRKRIKSKEYERLEDKTKIKIINQEENKVTDFVKNPIIINNKYNYKSISEKVLQRLILEDIPSFLEELGEGFTFISNEYKIKIGDIDLLLFNYIYNCFIVLELKVTELKKEHIGQIQTYMNYIDKNIKKITHDKTIGIIIVKKDNKLILEYSSDKRIYSTAYITS